VAILTEFGFSLSPYEPNGANSHAFPVQARRISGVGLSYRGGFGACQKSLRYRKLYSSL
jgi:hypothetical protein